MRFINIDNVPIDMFHVLSFIVNLKEPANNVLYYKLNK